jgi:exoribonuclease R
MKAIKILIEDRNYNSWIFQYPGTFETVSLDDVPLLKTLNPLEQKMFSRDVFIFDDENNVQITKSYLKSSTVIAGVLMLENNKTFGRTINKKRLLYKCIPDDKHLPAFLIPYDIKLGFSKILKNKYIVFKFDNWADKHPHGILVETLGDVDNLEVFYEYQLYCKSLYHSITEFTNKTRKTLNSKSNEEYIQEIVQTANYNIQDRTKETIITIDPLHSTDFDDGLSIETLPNGQHRVSVYIANVYFWLETLGLWKSFSKRVSTIYLPDRRRPMLPTILSDTLCSLQQDQPRFALAMDFYVDADGNIINPENIQHTNVIIKVKKNYVYEDPKMLAKDQTYQKLFEISAKMDKSVVDSHDVIAHWMVLMNMHTGLKFMKQKIGIFRSASYINPNLGNDVETALDQDTSRVIRSWNNVSGHYNMYNENIDLSHEVMNKKSYIHITSPIRRLVDLLNQMILMKEMFQSKNISDDANQFLMDWLEEMEYINLSMKSIRKIQTECDILQRCFAPAKNSNGTNIMDHVYNGVVFDKNVKGPARYGYMVYLTELKLLSRINTQTELTTYGTYSFKIYLFEDEDKTQKKIRLQLVENQVRNETI